MAIMVYFVASDRRMPTLQSYTDESSMVIEPHIVWFDFR